MFLVIVIRWILTDYRTINPLDSQRGETESCIKWIYVRAVKIHHPSDLYHVPQYLYNLNHLLTLVQLILTNCLSTLKYSSYGIVVVVILLHISQCRPLKLL